GSFEAVNATVAAAQLRSQGFVGFKVKEKPKGISETLTFLQPAVKTNDLVVFTRQFAVMIDAGLPLVTALGILGEQQANPTFQRVLREVKADVEGGATFADSLRRHPKPFSDLYVNLVASGEVGGILDTILNRLAVQLEKAEKLARQLRSAMVYPTTVSAIAVVVIVLLLVKVIPVFEKMFADFGGTLPAPTQIVLDLSDFMQANILWMTAALGLVVVTVQQARARSFQIRYRIDQLLLRLPLFGTLIKKVAVARFTRTLGTLVASGVPILDSLDIVASTAGNLVIEEEILKARESISEGKTIAEPLLDSKVFPEMMVQMVAVGEETGSMETMLTKVADFYDDQVDAAVAGLTSMLEPVMLVFMGGSVGAILIAMYLPIFTIADAIN
ncbi:MAG: type II secretion system F family protein, partial [Myxococcota bacterium]|nr:type II secretion system F family protein [Myxococcota bacterium]